MELPPHPGVVRPAGLHQNFVFLLSQDETLVGGGVSETPGVVAVLPLLVASPSVAGEQDHVPPSEVQADVVPPDLA